MLFYIDMKTQKIHTKKCLQLIRYLDLPLALRTKLRFYLSLGLHKNLESAVLKAINKGYINASADSCCCNLVEW
ncbi:hypothetical protein [Psychrilyobacter atlanticus]|uniref:hypothetical protein n=1 Tax=Psychrilyobacter atlanticus TaxID=271091 RepID=UPI00048B15F5|nr:hypothetical protein [Psychrilyobacter atlanticus]